MITEYAITTIDNPFDYFDQFSDWYLYDELHGYHTCSYLARVARTSDQLSDTENAKEIERAIDEIIRLDLEGIYKKISRVMDLDAK